MTEEHKTCQQPGCEKLALFEEAHCWGHLPEQLQRQFRIKLQHRKDRLYGAVLQGADLRHADLTGADLGEARMEGAKLAYANMRDADLCLAKLNGAILRHAHLEQCVAESADFSSADLTEADLRGARLRGTVFKNSVLLKARLQPHIYINTLKKREKNGSELSIPVLDQKRTEIRGANLRDTDLREADLTYVMGWDSDFRSADFTGATLTDADIWNSDLRGAILRDANLVRADLRWCKLYDADLTRVRIDGADLREVKQVEYKLLVALDRVWFLRWLVWPRLVLPFIGSYLGARKHGDRKKQLPRANFSRKRSLRMARRLTRFTRWRSRERQTKWAGVSGVDTCVVDDSLTRRYIKDVAFIEDFRSRHRFLAFWWKITCFYGQSFTLLALWCLAFALVFGLAYARYPCPSWFPDWLMQFLCAIAPQIEPTNGAPTGFMPYYYSIVTFTTLGFGDVVAKDLAGQIWVTAEVILGYIGLGGLISILANKVARRA